MAKLTGEEAINGVNLSDRYSSANRETARKFLADSLEELGYDPQYHDYGSGKNVYAILEATEDSDAYILFGGHYDGVSGTTAANDNASGTVITLSLARYLLDVNCRSVNVMIAFFDEEERGLLGSDAMAKWLKTENYNVISVHTVDMMAWDSDEDRTVEIEQPDGDLLNFYMDAAAVGGLTMPLVETSSGGTDHVAFRKNGYTAVGLCEEWAGGDTTPHYHSSSDTYDTVHFEYMKSTTTLVNYVFAYQLQPGKAAELMAENMTYQTEAQQVHQGPYPNVR